MIGDPVAIEPMLDMLRTWPEEPFPPPYESRRIYEYFLRVGEVAFKRMLILQQDQDYEMRHNAVLALQRFNYPKIRELVDIFEHFDKHLLRELSASQAIYLIRNLGGSEQPIPVLVMEARRDRTIQLDYTLILSHIGHEWVIPRLVKALQEAEPVWRQVMIEHISQFGTPEAREALEQYRQQTKI